MVRHQVRHHPCHQYRHHHTDEAEQQEGDIRIRIQCENYRRAGQETDKRRPRTDAVKEDSHQEQPTQTAGQ